MNDNILECQQYGAGSCRNEDMIEEIKGQRDFAIKELDRVSGALMRVMTERDTMRTALDGLKALRAVDPIVRDAIKAENDALRDAAERARNILLWQFDGYCPYCGEGEQYGDRGEVHAETCPRQLALAALDAALRLTPSSTLDLRGIREQIQLVASRITNNEYTEGDVATLFQVAERLDAVLSDAKPSAPYDINPMTGGVMVHSDAMQTCVWTEDGDGNWDTACDQIYDGENSADLPPSKWSIRFCQWCGKPIKEIAYAEPPFDEDDADDALAPA